MDSGTTAWMECVTVNIMWKVLHSMWTVVLQHEWSVLQWTLCGRYCTAGGQWYCSMKGVCYSEQYVKALHCKFTVVLQVECSVLQWTLCGRYCTAGGQWYCSLNVVCYSEQYVEGTAQQVDSVIAGWMQYVTVNIIWKLLHSSYRVVLNFEWSVLEWTLFGSYCTAGGQFYLSFAWSVLQ